MRCVAVVFVALLLCLQPQAGRAQDFQRLFGDFDARSLTWADKRFLQAALAFEGDYRGLLDGAWGRLSQQALERYARREFQSEALDWHMAMLAWSLAERVAQDGWDMWFVEPMGVSVLWPDTTILREPDSDLFLNYRHRTSSLALSLGIHSDAEAEGVHAFTVGAHDRAGRPYTVRKPGLAVSSATRSDGSTLYARSDFVNGAWSTVVIAAGPADGALLNTVAASISVGRAPGLSPTIGGRLDRTIRETVAILEEAEREDAGRDGTGRSVASRPDPDPGSGARGGSGSGFVVSESGHVLTNAHVVERCEVVLVDGTVARIVAVSEEFDLALLHPAEVEVKGVAVFAAGSARLNSDVTAVGYPYAGLLGGLNVTRGTVSALKGLGGDARTMQITSPVQSGNSGGPLLSSGGAVVGVVVAKLDAEKVADVLGDMPQNVNFAVRGEIAKLFLAQNGVEPRLSLAEEKLAPELIADRASAFTTFVECR